MYEVSTSTRIFGFAGSVSWPHPLLQADRQHIAVRGVQDGVFRKIYQNRETVALAAAENDQIGVFLLRDAEHLRLGVAGSRPGGGQREPSRAARVRRDLTRPSPSGRSRSGRGHQDSPMGSTGTNSTTCRRSPTASHTPPDPVRRPQPVRCSADRSNRHQHLLVSRPSSSSIADQTRVMGGEQAELRGGERFRP